MNNRIAFIGGGNMAFALIKGLIASDANLHISVADPFPEALEKYQDLPVETGSNNNTAIQAADAIVLAVKPQVARDVVTGLTTLQPDQLVISIAAGINLASLTSWTHSEQALVRCMPNTPALVQQGITGLYANTQCSDAQRTLASQILNAVGQSLWLETEAQIDAVTAVSGSGPAYFFLLMEAMVNAGTELGLSQAQATQLTLQTALGAASMATTGDAAPHTLRQNVTSPGGTTAAALQVMQDAEISATITSALSAACTRAAQLAEEFGS